MAENNNQPLPAPAGLPGTEHLLGPRLQAVAALVPRGLCLGDIGTDHAYLPITLFAKGHIRRAVAVDVHRGPFLSALKAVQARGLEGAIDVRLGDGLGPLRPGEVDVLTIAGMGGRTMLEILAAGPAVLNGVSDLIVQPQGLEAGVRQELLKTGWRLRDERLVEEDGRIYVVMAFSRQTGWGWDALREYQDLWVRRLLTGVAAETGETAMALFWQFGPLIWRQSEHCRNELLGRQLTAEYAEISHRLDEMKKARSPLVQHRRRQDRQTTVLLARLIEQRGL